MAGINMRDSLLDKERCDRFQAEHDGILMDFTRQRMTQKTLDMLVDLAKAAKLEEKRAAMAAGNHINSTEDRAVMHIALRAARDETYMVDGVNVVAQVHEVLDKVQDFAEKIRTGEIVGSTGKMLKDVVCVGIGGSYLATKFVHEALRTDPAASSLALGRLRFYANVDPVEFPRCVEGLDPETTITIIISKTFTTAETILNAKVMKQWYASAGITDISAHLVAVSTNTSLCEKFGIRSDYIFTMWDWVGGRYSVTSCVGTLPLSIQYGFGTAEQFLAGARNIDHHFFTAPLENNLPVLMGLIGVWNASFLGKQTRAVLPYAQALVKFAGHIQQLSMESNGKGVTIDGNRCDYQTGVVEFGEPGTDGQHSFYQLLHQGRVVPADFIGFSRSQHPVHLKGEVVSNHDELMANFFAQPDVMARGKTLDEVHQDGVPFYLLPHKWFSGNRPSISLLFPGSPDAYTLGQLLSLYEHRTAVEGFIWNLNSFDQWGVELGKVLASKVRDQLAASLEKDAPVAGFCGPTQRMMERYIQLNKS